MPICAGRHRRRIYGYLLNACSWGLAKTSARSSMGLLLKWLPTVFVWLVIGLLTRRAPLAVEWLKRGLRCPK